MPGIDMAVHTSGFAIAIKQLHDMASVWDDNPVYIVGTPVHYAPYQEFGSSQNAAQPYMRPAVRKARGQIKSEMRKADDMDDAVSALADIVLKESQRNAPVRTGKLRDSIYKEKRR